MARRGLAERIPEWWYRPQLVPALWPLLPLSWLFALVSGVRRVLYRHAFLPTYRLPVPVIVVGNLAVGGSGKTPLVLWLVRRLQERGRRPGIISRGYGGSARGVHEVKPDSDCSHVGDEPLLLARRSGVPVFISRDRVAAGRALLAAYPECDLLVADDGLQHYRLQRTIEIAVVDSRGRGNGHLLPAGPLREPWRRLTDAFALVWNSTPPVPVPMARRVPRQFSMQLVGDRFLAVRAASTSCDAAALRSRRLHAIAGIGNPRRFFSQLRALGLDFEEHAFADHHAYRAADLAFAREGVLLMTEKDAVKCAALVTGEAWVLPVDAVVDAPPGEPDLVETLLEQLHGRTPA